MSIGEQIVATAKTFLGTPYKTLDCNELVRSTFRKFGVELGDPSAGNAKSLYNKGLALEIPKSAKKADIIAMLNVGDLVFWGNPKYPTRWREIHHVAIYIGNGQIIESAGEGVHIKALWESAGTDGWQIILIGYAARLIKQEDDIMLKKRTSPMQYLAEDEALQKALNRHGANLKVDGKFGKNTEEAVKAFQASKGLPQTGVVDTKTAAALWTADGEDAADNVELTLKIGALNRQVESLQGHLRQFLKLADGIKI